MPPAAMNPFKEEGVMIIPKHERLIQYKKQNTKFFDHELEQLIDRLPGAYYKYSDEDDILQNLKYLELILKPAGNTKNKIIYQSDIETFAVMKYDYTLLKNTIKELCHHNSNKTKLFRLYRDKNNEFFILGSYHNLEDPRREGDPNLQKPRWENLDKRINISHYPENHHTVIDVQVLNTSMITLTRNILECLDYQRDFSFSFIEIWMDEKLDKKTKAVFKVSIRFFQELAEEGITSLEKDLERYLQKLIAYRSIFDIVGPAMVGPSSSHTAGANRIGHISRNILHALLEHGKIKTIHQLKVKLIGSFRDTGMGHHTPEAIIGGLCGFPTDDERMINAGIEAVENKQDFNFTIAGRQIKFGGFIKGDASDDSFYKEEHNSNIAEIIAVADGGEVIITGFSIGGGNVEIRFINKKPIKQDGARKVIDGKKKIILNYQTLTLCQDPAAGIPIAAIYEGVDAPANEYVPGFNTMEEVLELFGADTNGTDLIEKITAVETQISGMGKALIMETMKKYWRIMQGSIEKGLKDDTLSKFELTGQDSSKIVSSLEGGLMGLTNNIFSLSLAYAISVNEVNAKSGVIIACPTGGACGILPAVLAAWKQTHAGLADEEKDARILEAMIVAGFFGMILFDDVPTAGADLGCQAEIGGGAAMTAAALVHLENGTLGQAVQAFTLALKNCMGLVCDPVAGLVEVPCVKRNGIYATAAVSAALCALAGVRSQISADEVILAVKEVGERMHGDYKETARGGLAQTRDGKKVSDRFAETTRKFFG
jgi:L-serine dehydratase